MKYMLRSILLLFAITLIIRGEAQNISKDGWYFLKYPESNMFGVGYIEPTREGITVGACKPFQIDSGSVSIHIGANEQTNFENQVKNVFFTSVVSSNENISIGVVAKNVKKQILNPELWSRICQDNQFYFVTEALTADTVTITVGVNNSNKISFEQLAKIHSLFSSHETAPYKVVDASSASIDIIDISKLKNRYFDIKISNPNVYYAIKLARITDNHSGYWDPFAGIYTDEIRILDSKKLDPQKNTLLYAHDGGNNITVKIQYENGLPVFVYTVVNAKGRILKTDKDQGKHIDETTIQFDNTIPIETEYKYYKASALKKSKSQSKMYFIAYTCEYNTNTKSLKILGKTKTGSEYLLQNCIYAIRSEVDFWPPK
jgi:hypothetical protein